MYLFMLKIINRNNFLHQKLYLLNGFDEVVLDKSSG